jgi:hypothetical protein
MLSLLQCADKRRVRSVHRPLFPLIALTLHRTAPTPTNTHPTYYLRTPARQRVPHYLRPNVTQREIPRRLNRGLPRPAVRAADAPTEAYTNTHQCPPDAHAPHAMDTLTRAHVSAQPQCISVPKHHHAPSHHIHVLTH